MNLLVLDGMRPRRPWQTQRAVTVVSHSMTQIQIYRDKVDSWRSYSLKALKSAEGVRGVVMTPAMIDYDMT